MSTSFALAFTLALSVAQVPDDWKEPIEPFRVIGNIYYVGTAELASYLIATPQGHILLDTPLESETPLVLESIRKLGFEPKDIRILLNSQAHYDHTGGLAELKRLSGATMMAGRGDAEILARGGRGDFAFGDRYPFPPVTVDRPLDDGDDVALGGVTLRVRLTPGHTRGASTYSTRVAEDGRTYDVVFAGSLSINPGVRLAHPESYPGIADDFARSIQILSSLHPDVFLSAHGGFFGLKEKAAAARSRAPAAASSNPFVDPERYARWLEAGKKNYETHLSEDRRSTER
jgi:metallo-beta-lactamase class B